MMNDCAVSSWWVTRFLAYTPVHPNCWNENYFAIDVAGFEPVTSRVERSTVQITVTEQNNPHFKSILMFALPGFFTLRVIPHPSQACHSSDRTCNHELNAATYDSSRWSYKFHSWSEEIKEISDKIRDIRLMIPSCVVQIQRTVISIISVDCGELRLVNVKRDGNNAVCYQEMTDEIWVWRHVTVKNGKL